jgi:MoxR-like ATPase
MMVKFIGTQIMNEAMLERFAITMQQEYPPVTTERKILKKEMALTGEVDSEFCDQTSRLGRHYQKNLL